LRDSEADAVDIILGDARHRLGDAPDHAYQLIVLDAFSSDAVPVHLLSREAIRLYRGKLAKGGLLVFNLSNRYLDLDPLVGRQAVDAELVCRIAYDLDVSEDEKRAGKQPSIWGVMSANESDLDSLATDDLWQPPALGAHSSTWTDDYSDLASYLILRPRRR
jgi:spermidine synthase